MRKQIFIAALAALSMIACQKEQVPEQAFEGEGDGFVATISNSEATRTTLDGTTVKWNSGDEVSINGIVYKAYPDAQNPTVANLWKKTIKSYTPYAPFTAYYPASLFDGKVATLPSVQKYGSFDLNPMYARSNNSTLEFRNLCAVLAITVKSGNIDKVKSIRVSSSNCAMCGAFTVSDDNTAVLKDAKAIDKTVTLECEPAVTPASDGTVFYIAVPAQTYRNLKIELSSDGNTYTRSMTTKKDEDIPVTGSTIYSITFEADIQFSVSATKKVQFTSGNLWWGKKGTETAANWHLEENQTDYQTTWNPDHVSHLYWTKTAAASYAMGYNENVSISDKFFADGSDDAHKLTVDGQSGLYALNLDEWRYLLYNRTNHSNLSRYGVTVTNGSATYTNCVIIAPDDYSGTALGSITDWRLSNINALGLVCLPAAGYRNGDYLDWFGKTGFYWMSAIYKFNSSAAYDLYFLNTGVFASSQNYNYRYFGFPVRLVSTVSE